MKIDKIAGKVAGLINKSEKMQGVLRYASDNPAMIATTSAFLVGTTIRPSLIMGITPNKTDAKYSASSSIASSVVELIGGFALFTPLKKSIEESSKQLYHSKDTLYHENKYLLRNYKSVSNRIYKMFTFPITSSIRFAMVPVIALGLNKLGLSKDKKVDVKA